MLSVAVVKQIMMGVTSALSIYADVQMWYNQISLHSSPDAFQGIP